MLRHLAIVPALGVVIAITAYFFKSSTPEEVIGPATLLFFNATASESFQELTEQFGLLDHFLDFLKDQSWQLFMFPSTVFFGGMVFSKAKKFAKEGFHDMFSISITTFVKDAEGNDIVAIRTLKEVPVDHIMFDEAATDVLKTAATTNLPTEKDGFHFVNFEGLPDARRNVMRLRSHCASEVSSLFGVFQALAAMRVGPIVCRKFCWAVTYDMEEEDEKNTKSFSFKTVALSVLALSKLSSKLPDDDSPTEGAKEMKNKETSQVRAKIQEKEEAKESENHIQHNKFRMILVELGCLRQAHLKEADDLKYETENDHTKHRWDTIRAMQNLFCLDTGVPPPTSTILCGTVTFSAPLQEEMPAPWESWTACNESTHYERRFIQMMNTKMASTRSKGQ